MLQFEGLSDFLAIHKIEVSILEVEIDDDLLRPLLILREEQEPPRPAAGMDQLALVEVGDLRCCRVGRDEELAARLVSCVNLKDTGRPNLTNSCM